MIWDLFGMEWGEHMTDEHCLTTVEKDNIKGRFLPTSLIFFQSVYLIIVQIDNLIKWEGEMLEGVFELNDIDL